MKKQIVTSGTSVISKKKKESLEAYLGSCLGVTLVDQHADVGGLLHLLLPEATGTDMSFQPESYATTGMPHFLKKLIDLILTFLCTVKKLIFVRGLKIREEELFITLI